MLSNYQRYRLYEMAPGISIWGSIILCITLSFWKPVAMMYFIIVFDVYWVLRVVYFSFYLFVSWRRFRRAIQVDWFKRLIEEFPLWVEKINVVFLPLYNEDWSVINSTLQALLKSSYPSKKLYVVISGEARKQAHWNDLQKKIHEHYKGSFADLIFYSHPSGLPDEIPGKGSNINYAEYQFKAYADARGWNYAAIIISVFDVDTVVHPAVFGASNLHVLPTSASRAQFVSTRYSL